MQACKDFGTRSGDKFVVEACWHREDSIVGKNHIKYTIMQCQLSTVVEVLSLCNRLIKTVRLEYFFIDQYKKQDEATPLPLVLPVTLL